MPTGVSVGCLSYSPKTNINVCVVCAIVVQSDSLGDNQKDCSVE